MAGKSDPLSDSFGTDDAEGWLGGIVADEEDFDGRTLWRLGLWGVAAVGSLTLGLLSSQFPVNAQRTQVAANDFSGRAQHIEAVLQENLLEARRLSAAIATLNGDRDRVFSRLSSLEQGFEVVTGSIKRDDKSATASWPNSTTSPIIESAPVTITVPQHAPVPAPPAASAPIAAAAPAQTAAAAPAQTAAAAPAQTAAAAPAPIAAAAPVESEPPPVIMAARSEPLPAEMASPSTSVIQTQPIPDAHAAAADSDAKAIEDAAVTPTDFGIDLGAANSISGLRALWRGVTKQHKSQLDGLRPLIAVRERRNGLGLQLRLIAGPIKDAAAAAQICATLSNANRDCRTTAFDGQRLSLATEPDEKAAPPRAPKPRKPAPRAQQPDVTSAAGSSSFARMLGIR